MSQDMIDDAAGWLKTLFAAWVRSLALQPVKVSAGEAELLWPMARWLRR